MKIKYLKWIIKLNNYLVRVIFKELCSEPDYIEPFVVKKEGVWFTIDTLRIIERIGKNG